MPRGGARRGAGRKALDEPQEPLLTYSLMVRPTDVGYLNQLGHGNLSLGLRRLIDSARIQMHISLILSGATSDVPGGIPRDSARIDQLPFESILMSCEASHW